MLHIKLGVHLASLRLPLKKALHMASELGVEAVEIDARGELRPADLTDTALRQVRKMLEDRNLRVAAIGFATRRGYDTPDDLDRRIDATKAAMRMAYRLGASVVVNDVGPIPADAESPAWRLLVESLTDLGRFGQHVGALLAADTGPASGEELARLIAALPPGSLAVNLNPGRLIIAGRSPAAVVDAVGEHIRHVHATDGARDRAAGRGLETPLGRGSVDYPQLLGQLEDHDYRGYFTLKRGDSADPLGDMTRAVQYLRAM